MKQFFNAHRYIVGENKTNWYAERYCKPETIDLKTFELFLNSLSFGFYAITSNTKEVNRYEFIYFETPLITSIDPKTILVNNIQSSQILQKDCWSIILVYKHIIIYINCIYLNNRYIIQPYCVGKGKRSLDIVLPSEVVKSLNIDPLSIFLLLQVKGTDNIELKILREENLAKIDAEDMIPVEKVPRLGQQVPSSKTGVE